MTQPPAANDSARTRGRPRRLAGWGLALMGIGLALLSAVVWVLTAPSGTGTLVHDRVRYAGLDDPRSQIQGAFALITAVAGLLTGIVALGLGDRGLGRRSVSLILAGLPLAGVTYLTGYLMGPPSEAAQLAAGATTGIEPAFTMSTPLLVLIWPMVTAMVVSVGILLSLIVKPPVRDY